MEVPPGQILEIDWQTSVSRPYAQEKNYRIRPQGRQLKNKKIGNSQSRRFCKWVSARADKQ
jgi:hypothetical protein